MIAAFSEKHVDLAIIGAGPAGSAAAIAAAQAGLQVLVMERLPFPRHRPGETLAPGVEPLFRQLGVWEEIEQAGFIRHPGHYVQWDGAPLFSGFGGPEEEPWRGFQAWRPVLDEILLQQASRLGVEVWQPCNTLTPIVRAGHICGIVTDRGEVHARYVVDATGRIGWLARKRGWGVELHSPRLLARYGYIETKQAAQWFLPELQAIPNGWIWMAQVLPRVVAWTSLLLNGYLGELPAPLAALPDAKPLKVGGASADVTWRIVRHVSGPGWFVVGDAGVVLDPTSSHGVLRALMSGIMVAHLCKEICGGRLDEEVAISTYQRWMWEWFDHDTQKLKELYAPHFPEFSGGEMQRHTDSLLK